MHRIAWQMPTDVSEGITATIIITSVVMHNEGINDYKLKLRYTLPTVRSRPMADKFNYNDVSASDFTPLFR
jgi:hypothetical protein